MLVQDRGSADTSAAACCAVGAPSGVLRTGARVATASRYLTGAPTPPTTGTATAHASEIQTSSDGTRPTKVTLSRHPAGMSAPEPAITQGAVVVSRRGQTSVSLNFCRRNRILLGWCVQDAGTHFRPTQAGQARP